MTELASCPFCGGTPRLFPETYSDDNPNEVIGSASINCQECSCLVHGDWSDEAIAAWNRRAPAPAETGWQMRKEANPPPNREHFDILATALSEIKATSDGHSDQPVADIIAWCLAEIAALSAPAETGWRTMDSAPRDGTRILALLYREATHDMDDRYHRSFSEVREIFYKSYTIFGMELPWHAGDPMDSHDGIGADSHMGDAVPIGWMPRATLPAAPSGEEGK